MKLRTTHNSIRVRIRKSELAELQKSYLIEESIRFPSGIVFKFAISVNEETKQLKASLSDNYLELSIPKKQAVHWITTNEVGIETNLNLDDNEQLHVLIEKDFPCLDRPEEDKSDTFWELAPENPDAC